MRYWKRSELRCNHAGRRDEVQTSSVGAGVDLLHALVDDLRLAENRFAEAGKVVAIGLKTAPHIGSFVPKMVALPVKHCGRTKE